MKSKPTQTRAYNQGARAEAAEETHQRIVDAFVALVTEHWLEDITLAEVAARSGVTVQTVIRRFGGKDGLIDAFKTAIGPAIEARRHAGYGSIASAVTALVADYEITGDSVVRLLAQEQRHPALKPVLAHGRASHRKETERVFAEVLETLSGAARERHLKGLIAFTDVYVWQIYRRDMGLSQKETTALMLETVTKFNAAVTGTPATMRRAS
ncbi:hypothetical protein sos41_08990 [Alphaproteobacteria bacterium SO-S41]|nr:hypothetical protein sos41_08990 [Alphaproteobacteria bacterium SO-S41]